MSAGCPPAAHFRSQTVRINFLHVKTTHSGQMLVSDQLLRQFGERDAEMQRRSFRVGFFASVFGRRLCQASLSCCGGRSPSTTLAVRLLELAVASRRKVKRSGLAHGAAGNFLNQILRIADRLAIEFDDDVVRLHAGFRRRSWLAILCRLHVHDDRALRFGQAIDPRKLVVHRFERDAEIAAPNFALRDNLLVNEIRFVRRQREADAVVVAGRGGDLRVHADHFAAHVDQRTAAVAAIDGGVSLQEALKVGEERGLAFFLGDDSGGNRLVQTERRTDRQHPVADLRRIRIAERHCRQILRRVDLDYRDVSLLIDADHPAAILFAGLQADDYSVAILQLRVRWSECSLWD